MAELGPLRRHMIEDMTIRNMSPATQRSYISAVSKFSRRFGRSPDKLTLDGVHAFQVHLVSTGISWPGLNQTVCALRFFYGVTLGEEPFPSRFTYAREPRASCRSCSAPMRSLRFLEAVSESEEPRAALTTAYAAGLRASGRGAPSRGCRQRPWRHSGASRQGREGPQRDAVATSFSASCARTGGSPGRRRFCSRAAMTIILLIQPPCCTLPAGRRSRRPG